MTFKIKTIAVACGLAVTMTANAGFIGLESNKENPASFKLGSNNFFVDDGDPSNTEVIPELADDQKVLQDHRVVANTNDQFNLTFTYMGHEAGFQNRFLYDGDTIFDTAAYQGEKVYSISKTFLYDGSSGDLPFSFETDKHQGTGATADSVVNGPDNDSGDDMDFFTYEFEEDVIYLGLDDGGANDDDNHDDQIIRVTATKVPEPGTLALLGLGLAGLGMSYRRRS